MSWCEALPRVRISLSASFNMPIRMTGNPAYCVGRSYSLWRTSFISSRGNAISRLWGFLVGPSRAERGIAGHFNGQARRLSQHRLLAMTNPRPHKSGVSNNHIRDIGTCPSKRVTIPPVICLYRHSINPASFIRARINSGLGKSAIESVR